MDNLIDKETVYKFIEELVKNNFEDENNDSSKILYKSSEVNRFKLLYGLRSKNYFDMSHFLRIIKETIEQL